MAVERWVSEVAAEASVQAHVVDHPRALIAAPMLELQVEQILVNLVILSVSVEHSQFQQQQQ